VFMSNAMHRAGLVGVPRRTAEPQYQSFDFSAAVGTVGELQAQIALGGTLLFVSVVLFLFNVLLSAFEQPIENPVDDSLPAPLSGASGSPVVLDNLRLWTAIAVVLVILAYTLPLAGIVGDAGLFGDVPGVPMRVGTLVESLAEVIA